MKPTNEQKEQLSKQGIVVDEILIQPSEVYLHEYLSDVIKNSQKRTLAKLDMIHQELYEMKTAVKKLLKANV
ncbi:MAG: hypothetical protein FWG20_00085 [Candidatus Cloacimonetes bacterium]|nr:hypothetical protein [Candidatus Cloacimonadota bacterium]